MSALWLYYAEDRTTKEVATIIGRSVAWVKVTLHRSRRRLAESIDAADWLTEEGVSNEYTGPGTTLAQRCPAP